METKEDWSRYERLAALKYEDITEQDLDTVEGLIGMGRGAWDMVDHRELVLACVKAVRIKIEKFKVDWSGWIAVLFEHDDGDCNWCIAPKEFWQEHHSIPNHCLDHVPTGFFECQEHTLDSLHSLPEQERLLREHGFEIVEWPN